MTTARPSPGQHRIEGLEVLYKISNIINTTQDREKVLKAVLKEVVRLTAATSGSIAMLDSRRGVLGIETAINIPARTWKRLKLQLGVGVTGWAAYKGESVRVDDVRRESRYVRLKPDIRSELAVPMFINGKVIGVINVDSTRRAAFTEEHERLLKAVAEQSAKVIETARLYEMLKKHARQMESLFELGRQFASPEPLTAVLERVTAEGRKLLDADACVFVTVNDEGDLLTIRAQDGGSAAWLESPSRRVEESLLAPVVRTGQPLLIEELGDLRPFWGGQLDSIEEFRSLFAVPIKYQDHVLGVVAILSFEKRTYGEQETSLLNLLANQTALAVETSRRQERLFAMEENLHRAERFSLLGTLAAEIAHEIRNPVTIMNLLLDSVAEETRDNPQVSNDLAIVREKVDRIDRIVEQTLSMARNREPELHDASINSIVSDVMLFMHYKFAKTGTEVRVQLDEGLPDLKLDRGQIQQILINILVNALQALGSDERRVVIRTGRVDDEELGDCVVLSVQDSGCGIRREDLNSLFEPFFTTHSRGTGLGLFVSRKLAVAHGGDIRVQTREGKGSMVTVLLPVMGKNQEAASTQTTAAFEGGTGIPPVQRFEAAIPRSNGG